MSRPSASVLVISTVLPFMARTTSPGRVEYGPGMFSTAGATAMTGRSGASCLMVAMAEMTVQAPVLSVFISSIRSAGLMLMPPESKQTPLPTMASSRPLESVAPAAPLRMTMKRGVLAEPLPTAMNMPMPSASACSGPRMSIWRPCRLARSVASSARTSGLTSLADRCDSRRVALPPSPMIRPRSAAALSRATSPCSTTMVSTSSTGGEVKPSR